MTNERLLEIKNECKKRVELWLKNESWDRMTVCNSLLRFQMSLGLIGYPFKKEKWMKNDEFNRFITDEEYDDYEVDEIIIDLFYEYQKSNT